MRNSLILALLGTVPVPAFAQNGQYANTIAQPPNRVVTVVPGKAYAAGTLHRMLLGAQYRELWITPIEVPVLDLEHFAGGLTPMKRRDRKSTV